MTIKDQIHALRWRAAADALALDPSYDPSLAALREIQKRADDFSAVSDLLAERMALLDAERPGVTLIECVQGMLEATAQKPAAPRGPLLEAVHVADRMTADDVGHALWLCGYHPGDDPREVFKLAAARAAEWQEIEAATRQIAMEGPGAPLKVPEVVEKLLADRERAEAAERKVVAADSRALGAHQSMKAAELRAERAEATLAAADIDGIRARSSSRADALHVLGWSGEGDPKAWAEKQAARQSGCDVHAKLATATRDAKTRGDALRALGWNGAEHPEAWAPRLRESCRIGREMLDKAEKDLAALTAAHDKALIHGKRWVQACKATGHDPDGEGLIANTRKAMEALVEPLRAVIYFYGEPTPARVVEEAATMLGRLGREHEAMAAQIAVIDKAIGLTAGVERMDRLASLVHDAATCEQHRRLVDTIDEAMAPAFAGAVCIPGPVLDRAQELVRRVMSADKAPPLSEAIAAAHRWRAVDLQALLEHERHKQREADKDLVELTRPIWVLLPRGAPRDMSPRGVVQQMAEILAAVACAGV